MAHNRGRDDEQRATEEGAPLRDRDDEKSQEEAKQVITSLNSTCFSGGFFQQGIDFTEVSAMEMYNNERKMHKKKGKESLILVIFSIASLRLNCMHWRKQREP